ncbi:hypothetical protein EDD85DRAFT_1026039 [Armillaria nabsnona]|nr:hypothetical protein EDD85DRAFT_1026039 [Armillaria nabsnona]
MSEDQNQNFNHLIDGLHQILGPSTSFGDSMTATNQSFQMFQGYMHPGFMYATQSTPQLNHPPEHVQNFPSQFIYYPSVSNPYMNPYNDPSYTYQNIPPPHYIQNFPSQTTYQFRNSSLNNSQNGTQGTTQNTVSPPAPPPIPPHPNRPPLPQPPLPPTPPIIAQPPPPTPPPPPNNIPNTARPPYPHVQPNTPLHQYRNVQPQI